MREDEYQVPGYGVVKKTLTRWWVNCGYEPDDETKAIDALEDAIGPLDDQTAHIRKLIGSLELCHYKVERHVTIIIEAIGTGRTDKAKGQRTPGHVTAREREYEALVQLLSSWCSGRPNSGELRLGRYTAKELLDLLGERTALKVWQVGKVVEKVQRFADPHKRWNEAYENVVDAAYEGEEAQFRDRTKQAIIHDTTDGQPAELTVAEAIDLFTGCNWDFLGTLRTLLAAIGGRLEAEEPIALHQRNIRRNPVRERMRLVANTLKAYGDGGKHEAPVDPSILEAFGAATPVKRWLAASLAKTLSLQLSL